MMRQRAISSKDVVYGDAGNRPLKLDIYRPADAQRRGGAGGARRRLVARLEGHAGRPLPAAGASRGSWRWRRNTA